MGKLHYINPYNKDDMKYLEDYDIALFISLKSKNSIPEEEYLKEKEKSVVEKDYYYTLKNDKIENFYIVEKEKDLKESKIYPKVKESNKKEIETLEERLINFENMDEVLLVLGKDKDKLRKLFKDENHEIIDDGIILREGEKELEKVKGRSI